MGLFVKVFTCLLHDRKTTLQRVRNELSLRNLICLNKLNKVHDVKDVFETINQFIYFFQSGF